MKRPLICCVAVALACGEATPAPDGPEDPDAGIIADSTGITVIRPDPPPVAPGRFALVTNAEKPEYRFRGHWPAEAQFCEETRALQLFVYDEILAVAVVAGIPDSGDPAGSYKVVEAREGLPAARTARVALQTYATDRAYSLAGVEGTVVIDSLTDTVSGQVAVAVFESVFLDSVQLAASFRELAVRPAEPEACRVIGDPADGSGTR